MKLHTRRRFYLREATVMLILARLALRWIAPARIFSWVDRPLTRVTRFSGAEIGWVTWAIESAAAKWPLGAFCLPRALAAHAMLRRRGIASRLCLGVARHDGELAAHAWVELGDNRVIGDTGSDRFRRIAEFGIARTV